MKVLGLTRRLACLAVVAVECGGAQICTGAGGVWGIDACLTRHLSDAEFPAYVRLLESSGVRIIRERDVGVRQANRSYERDVRAKFQELRARGFMVDAFVSQPTGLKPERNGDVLPEDLCGVFQLGKVLTRDFEGLVDSWEMTGEPDIGFCRDLPDRLVAYQKALYLGFKDGGGNTPEVIMGALALPPGPWLGRAAVNGLLDYTDAYNFHFYGNQEDLAGVLRAHRKFIEHHLTPESELPIWITECGIKSVKPWDFMSEPRRRIQADYTVETAMEALAGGAAVFMPFILVHPGDPYALTLTANRPLPAWSAYAELTRKVTWPSRQLARRNRRVSPVVMQWLPDEGAAVPHKVSGTYRFRFGRPMTGEVRIYNFGSRAVQGQFIGGVAGKVRSTFPTQEELSLQAGQVVTLRGAFQPKGGGYLQAWWQGAFVTEDGLRSPLFFGLETTPEDRYFKERLLALTTEAGKPRWPYFRDYRVSSVNGRWVGINGVTIQESRPSGGRFLVTELTGDPAGDPLYPPAAIAELNGLPKEGFLVVRPEPMMDANMGARVDLVDKRGQRFTIWENLGQSYTAPRKDLWLNLKDFHIYFWGKCSDDPTFHPEDVRELQLRFYCFEVPRSISLEFALAEPR